MQPTAFSCPEKHTHVQRNIHGLETVDPGLWRCVLYAALTVTSPQSKQGGALSGVAPHVWRIVPTLASGTICARFGYYDVQMSTRRTHTVAPRKIAEEIYGCNVEKESLIYSIIPLEEGFKMF